MSHLRDEDDLVIRYRSAYERCEHELRRLRSAGDWQPIETAPKDGTLFLGLVDREVRFVSWGKTSHVPIYGFCVRDQGPEQSDICDATHWMPLPSAPPSNHCHSESR